jgi:hypothetical protein
MILDSRRDLQTRFLKDLDEFDFESSSESITGELDQETLKKLYVRITAHCFEAFEHKKEELVTLRIAAYKK